MTNSFTAKYLSNKDLHCIKLAHTIRIIVGFSKKVMFKAMREMRNGAIWIMYTVDGVQCSTFAKAAKVRTELNAAHISAMDAALKYAVEYFRKVGSVAVNYDDGDTSITVVIAGIKYYIRVGAEYWELGTRKNFTVANLKALSLRELFDAVIKNPITVK
jgi:hypothetical protein